MKVIKLIIAYLVICILAPQLLIAQTFTYEIKGEIKGLKNDTLIFAIDDDKGGQTLMQAIGNNDKFSIKGTANFPRSVFAQIGSERSRDYFSFFLDKGIITIKGDRNDLQHVKVSGTPINDEYTRAAKSMDVFYKRLQPLQHAMREMEDRSGPDFQQLQEKASVINKELLDFQVKYIKEHPKSMFSATRLHVLSDRIELSTLDELFSALQSPAKELAQTYKLADRIAAKKVTAIGQLAYAFSAKDKDGKLIELNDFKGKYVLLEFWASWCVPCRKESPALRKAYQLYKDEPFEIISISSDEDEKKWLEAIVVDQIGEWIHISDSRSSGNHIASAYGVQPIPDNFLIDPKGKIIARKLSGNELEKTLQALFKP